MNRHNEQERLRRAIAALPELPLRVFHLHGHAGLDYIAIAERLGISVPEVEAALVRALVLIMRAMDGEDLEKK